MPVCDDKNSVTMTPQDKNDRSKYENNVKALENIQVLLNRFSNEKFQINYQLVKTAVYTANKFKKLFSNF